MNAIIWHDEDGKEREVVEIPDDYKEVAAEWHHKMLDVVAAEDEMLLEKYLEDHDLDPEEIRIVIRRGTISTGCPLGIPSQSRTSPVTWRS